MTKNTALASVILLIAAMLPAGCEEREAPPLDETPPLPVEDGPSPLPGPRRNVGDTPAATYASILAPPEGEPLSAVVTITRAAGTDEAFELAWTGDGLEARGVGITFGENLFAVARVGPRGLDVGVYRLEEGGLVGRWTDGGGIGAEVIGEARGEPPVLAPWPDDALFEVAGAGPDGREYRGYLQVKAWDGAAVLRWTIGEELIPGGGLLVGDRLVAGFNEGTYGVSVYEREGDGWRGRWFAPGNPGLGVESLTPYTR